MSKENEFKKSLKYENNSNSKSGNILEEAYKQKFLSDTVKTPYLDSEIISEDQMVNLAKWNKDREYDKKYESIKNEQLNGHIYKPNRRVKNKPSKGKVALKTAGALGLSVLTALGAFNLIKNNFTEPEKSITYQEAIQAGIDPNKELGLRESTQTEILQINELLQDTSKLTTSDAYHTVLLLNSTYHNVLDDKLDTAIGKQYKKSYGIKFEEGQKVQYVNINNGYKNTFYFKESTLNSLVGEKTIPDEVSNTIDNIQEIKDFIIEIQEQGEQKPLEKTIEFCKEKGENLNQFAAIPISYNGIEFEAHPINRAELNKIAEENGINIQQSRESMQDAKNNNFKEAQNAVKTNNEHNNEEIRDVNYEYDDDGR